MMVSRIGFLAWESFNESSHDQTYFVVHRTMSIPDLINGSFELLGGAFILDHCRHVLKDKAVAGVSIVSTIFFTGWGIWNLYFYPHLGQWISFVGGLFIMTSNIFWIYLLLKYRKAT